MLNVGNLGGAYKSDYYEVTDNHAATRFINSVLSDMDPLLTSRQLTELNNVLQKVLENYSISADGVLYDDIDYHELNDRLLTQFLEDKRLAGLSEKTLEQYERSIIRFLNHVDKGLDSVTTDDFRDFFEFLVEECGDGKATVDNYRRYFNSFYVYLVNNGLVYRNPLLKINKIKSTRKVKHAFTNRELIYMRENIQTLRDKAIFELLLSSGMRIGELGELNIKDLDMNNCSVIVHGKGDKEREAYFNELAKVSIERYLESRTDNNPALFVSYNRPYNRFGGSGIGRMLRNIGERAGVEKVHAHRFRRHFATTLLKKGVHIEQIQKLLGHEEIDTTQLYVVSDEDEIKYNHKRYVN